MYHEPAQVCARTHHDSRKVPAAESEAQLGRPMKGRRTNSERRKCQSTWRPVECRLNESRCTSWLELNPNIRKQLYCAHILVHVARFVVGIMKSLTRTTFTKLFWYDLASVCKGFSGCLFFYVKAWISYRPARAKAREREKRETFPSENINGKLNISKDVTSYSRGEFTTSDQLVNFPSRHFFAGRRSYG